MSPAPPTGADLIRSVGLLPDGPAVLGRPLPATRAGVFVVELPAPLPAAPIEMTRVGKWIERVPTLRLDGERPTSKQLAARLAAFWLPRQVVLYVGSTDGSVAARLAALERHVLGDPRPHPSSQWLRTLRVDALRVWWAATDAPEEHEDALLDAFAAGVGEDELALLPDRTVVLPFANLRRPTGERKGHGITGATLPAEVAPPAPPTRRVEVPPGAAEGAQLERRGSGTVRRTNTAPPTRRAPARSPTRTSRPSEAAPRGAAPVHVTPDGLARLQAELDELRRVRRPQVIARVKSARELGDLRENAEYHSAREEQSFLEGRIQAIEATLRTAVSVEAPAPGDRAAIGSRLRVEVDGDERVLTIVGPTESDPDAGRISNVSPVGRALLGSRPGDEVAVRTPAGEARYRIVAID